MNDHVRACSDWEISIDSSSISPNSHCPSLLIIAPPVPASLFRDLALPLPSNFLSIGGTLVAITQILREILPRGYSTEPKKAVSPRIDPKDVLGKTPAEIDKLAVEMGLKRKGPNPQGGQGAYVDPVSGQQRILIHPGHGDNHCHVNNPNGDRLDINGRVVSPEAPEAHLPLK